MIKDKNTTLARIKKHNRSITSLTPAQHNALEYLATVRHKMHVNQEAFIKADAANHSIFTQYILNYNVEFSINQHLTKAGLPSIQFPDEIYKVLFCDAVSRNDFYTDYDYLMQLSINLDRYLNITEALNTTIENYLRVIDLEYHTIYCPRANYRLHITREKRVEQILKQFQQQTVIMDMDWNWQLRFPVVPKIDIMASKRPVNVRQRLFVDLDGTLATFHAVHDTYELCTPGYYSGLLPNWNVLYAIQDLIKYHSQEIDVYVISSVHSNTASASREKNGWLNRYLPALDKSHRLFCPRNIDRTLAAPRGLYTDDYLLDDNNRNLAEWAPPARAVKLLNGLNHLTDPWPGDSIRFDRSSHDIRNRLLGMMKHGEHMRDIY